ncbi:MAG: nucleotide synthetase, partial [Allosphingosinicella sp.]|uniref:nucleotide synthetase n=1 Tax=Allosphingosinicella sp. TaxID=2823234 RepID=UPI00393EA887
TKQNKIGFVYHQMGSFEFGSDAEFQRELKKVASGGNPPNHGKPRGGRGNRRSHLSVDNKENIYIVFRLDPKWNWRFSRDVPAFSLFEDKCRPNDEEYYGSPVALTKSGEIFTPPSGDKPLGEDEVSRIAYFTALGKKAYHDPARKGPDRFNIHVNLVEDPGDDGLDKYIPLIIDPDVGHPGGSGPP